MFQREIEMNITKNIGMLLLAIWLILSGLSVLVTAIGSMGPVLPILAIAAGVCILIGR